MTYFMFQEQNGIHLYLKNKRKTTEESVQKQEMWTFTDIECQVDKKVVFKWNTLF